MLGASMGPGWRLSGRGFDGRGKSERDGVAFALYGVRLDMRLVIS